MPWPPQEPRGAAGEAVGHLALQVTIGAGVHLKVLNAAGVPEDSWRQGGTFREHFHFRTDEVFRGSTNSESTTSDVKDVADKHSLCH